jgi:hypothetical protein
MLLRWLPTLARIVALTAAFMVGADEADARVGGGLNVTSPAALIRTSLVAANGGLARGAGFMRGGTLAQLPSGGGSLSDLFRRGGLLGGFAAGFLGSGLLGLLFGRGLFGGLGGVPSYLGLLFQLALIVMLCRLIWSRWRHVDFAGVAGLSPRQLADPYLRSRDDMHAGLDSAADEDRNSARESESLTNVKEERSQRE